MGYADPQAQRDYCRAWVARRRAEWMAGKVCAECGATDKLQPWHPTRPVKGVWTRTASYRAELLAEAVVLCRRHAMKRITDPSVEVLVWCPAEGAWTDEEACSCREAS